ncbi:MAG: sodium:calcium antiporter, partial [Hoeflea sp.]|nr:sodium:calcium antiporter [Hoeflea sp.]
GGTSVILPLDVDPRIVSIDMWVMLAAALLVVGLAHWNIPVKKLGGLAMLAAFTVYIISVF